MDPPMILIAVTISFILISFVSLDLVLTILGIMLGACCVIKSSKYVWLSVSTAVISGSLLIAQTLELGQACLLTAAVVLLIKAVVPFGTVVVNWKQLMVGLLVLVTSAAIALNLQVQDLSVVLVTVIASLVPVPHQSLPSNICRRIAFCLLFLCVFALLASGVFRMKEFFRETDVPVAILDHGVWAESTTELGKASVIDQKVMYSYSELRRLLGAEIISEVGPLQKSKEIWTITPTKPFSEDEIDSIKDWVWRGGHLVAVSDHTDFLGHATALNKLLAGFSIEVSDTAFFPEDKTSAAALSSYPPTVLQTPNLIYGFGLLPVGTARWINEEADFSRANFFGDMSLSTEDKIRTGCFLGQKAFGAG